MNQDLSKNKKIYWLIAIVVALAGGPIGWIFLLIWLFSQGAKNKFKFDSQKGIFKHIKEANNHINSSQISGINEQISVPSADETNYGLEGFRIILIMASLIGILAIIIYIIYSSQII